MKKNNIFLAELIAVIILTLTSVFFILMLSLHFVYASSLGLQTNLPKVLIRHTHLNETDFQAQLIAAGSEYNEVKSFAEYASLNNVFESENKNEINELLTTAFLKAQETFLKSDLSQMKTDWEEVTSYYLKSDWTATYREMISIAFLRLAQISKSAHDTNIYLNEALSFDESYKPKINMLPPPLLSQYNKLQKRLWKTTLQTKNLMGFDLLFINGRLAANLKKNTKFYVTPGMKRFSLYSSAYKPVSHTLTLEEIRDFKPTRSPLVDESCTAQKLARGIKIEGDHEVLLPKSCLPENFGIQSHLISKSFNNIEPSINLKSATESLAAADFSSVENSKPFFKKTGFWWASAIVGGIALAIESSQNESKKSPSRREGF